MKNKKEKSMDEWEKTYTQRRVYTVEQDNNVYDKYSDNSKVDFSEKNDKNVHSVFTDSFIWKFVQAKGQNRTFVVFNDKLGIYKIDQDDNLNFLKSTQI